MKSLPGIGTPLRLLQVMSNQGADIEKKERTGRGLIGHRDTENSAYPSIGMEHTCLER
jgi:hypothetical protein